MPTVLPASVFPADGGALDLLDKRLSKALFRLQLGWFLEAWLSIPGCFFGMPAFHVVAPSLVAGALGGWRDASAQSLVVLAATAALLVAFWLYAQSSTAHMKKAKLLYLPPALIASPILGMLLVHAVAAADASAKGAAAFYLLVWNASIAPVITAKALAGRRRPVACDAAHIGSDVVQAAGSKALSNICTMLRSGDPNAAFPSGDVAGAVAFAYPLWRGCVASSAALSAPVLRATAVLCVLLSATGRMYWQAHHLLDVTCGGLISLVTCVALDLGLGAFAPVPTTTTSKGRGGGGGGDGCVATTLWWHPFAGLALLVVYAKLSGTQKGAALASRGPRNNNDKAK